MIGCALPLFAALAAPTVTAATSSVTAEPGTTVTVGFRVATEDFTSAEVVPGVYVGKPLQLVVPETGFTLRGPQAIGRPVAVRVPADAPAGDYAVAYVIGPGTAQLAETSIVVPAHQRITVASLTETAEVISGERLGLDYVVTNEGNVPVDLVVGTNLSESQWTARPGRLQLDIGQSATVHVDVTPVGRATGPLTRGVVTTFAEPGKAAAASGRTMVRVWPSMARLDPYQRFEVRATGWAVGRVNDQARVVTGQVGVDAAGALDADGRTRLDLLARWPRHEGLRFQRSYDELRATLSHRGAADWQLRAGDQTYQVSPLMGAGYLRGGEASATVGRLSVRAVGGVSRFAEDHPAMGGVSVGVRAGAASVLSVNAGVFDDDGLRPVLSHQGDIHLRLPGDRPGAWRYELAGSPTGVGVRQELTASLPAGAIRLVGTWTSPNYPGPLGNRDACVGEFRHGLSPTLTLSSRVAWVRFGRDPTVSRTGSQLVDGRLAIERRSTGPWRWSAWYQLRNQAPVSEDRGKAWLQHGLFGSVRRSLGPVALDAGTGASVRDELGGPRNGNLLGTVGATVTLQRWLQAGLALRTEHNPGYVDPPDPRIALVGRLHLVASTRTWLDAQWVFNAPPGGGGPNSLLIARGGLELPWHHSLVLDANATLPSRPLGPDVQVALGYQIPIGIPLRRRAEYGAIRGQVIDERTGEGVPGAVVRTPTRAARTDAQGRFLLPELLPGDQELFLSPDLQLLGKVALDDGGMVVTVPEKRRGSSVVDQDLFVTDGAAVTLEVVLYRDAGGAVGAAMGREPDLVPVRVLGRTAVELVQGEHVRRDVTDSLGRVTIRGLLPGEWTIKVASPSDTRVDTATATVRLLAGELPEHEVRVVPTRREIVIQDQTAPVPIAVPPPRPRVSPSTLELEPGQASPIEVTLAKQDVSAKLTWISKNPAIASVDGSGNVTAVSEGRTEIAITKNGKPIATIPVQVRLRPLVGLTLSTAPIRMAIGDRYPMSVRGIDTDGRVFDATERVVWVSEDPAVARFDDGATLTAVAEGRTRVYAEAQGVRSFQVDVVVGQSP